MISMFTGAESMRYSKLTLSKCFVPEYLPDGYRLTRCGARDDANPMDPRACEIACENGSRDSFPKHPSSKGKAIVVCLQNTTDFSLGGCEEKCPKGTFVNETNCLPVGFPERIAGKDSLNKNPERAAEGNDLSPT